MNSTTLALTVSLLAASAGANTSFAGSFNIVLNIGTEPVPGIVFDGAQAGGGVGQELVTTENLDGSILGSNSQLNLYDHGELRGSIPPFEFNVGDPSVANTNVELNIYGGWASPNVRVNSGSTANIEGGEVDQRLTARTGSTINVSGGIIERLFEAERGSVVNVSGGAIGTSFSCAGQLYATGGTIGRFFEAAAGSIIEVDGGVIEANASALPGSAVIHSSGVIGFGFTATGADVMIEGGNFGGSFKADAGCVVTFSEGAIGNFSWVANSTFVMNGGTLGTGFDIKDGSDVSISGGNIGSNFDVEAGASLNLIGSEFALDGIPLTGLPAGLPEPIVERDVTLSGVLEDGTPFAIDLSSIPVSGVGFVSPDAELTVTFIASASPADRNGDGVVDTSDLAELLALWGTPEGDLNGDGTTDAFDLAVLLAAWG